jgi:hypothetical protein
MEESHRDDSDGSVFSSCSDDYDQRDNRLDSARPGKIGSCLANDMMTQINQISSKVRQ